MRFFKKQHIKNGIEVEVIENIVAQQARMVALARSMKQYADGSGTADAMMVQHIGGQIEAMAQGTMKDVAALFGMRA